MIKHFLLAIVTVFAFQLTYAQQQGSTAYTDLNIALSDTSSPDYTYKQLYELDYQITSANIQPWIAFSAQPVSDSLIFSIKEHPLVTRAFTETIVVDTTNLSLPKNLSDAERWQYKQDLAAVGAFTSTELTFDFSVNRQNAYDLLDQFDLQFMNIGFGDQRNVTVRVETDSVDQHLSYLKQLPFVETANPRDRRRF